MSRSLRPGGNTVVGLDIGTTKTCAIVASSTSRGLDVIGFGEAPSRGIRRGVVTDLDEAVRSIEAATERAERMAGVHVSHVYVGVTGEHVQSANNRGVVAITSEDREVAAGDVRRVVDASKLIEVAADRQIIHALPRGYVIDGHDGISDPIGMAGARLEVDTHIVTGGSSFIANVLKCVERAGLETSGLIFEPLASSAATLRREEKQIGVVLLDIGGGTTDIAVYSGGGAVHTSTVPLGGNVVTNDLALGLKIAFADAEELKTSFGVPSEAEDAEEFALTTLDGRTSRSVSRREIRSIVMPRMIEIFRHARAQIAARLPRDMVVAEIVLTGGGAHLAGLERVAAEFFGLPVRVGVPDAIGGLTDAVRQPQYATAVGLLLFGPRADRPTAYGARRRTAWHARISSWFGDLWN